MSQKRREENEVRRSVVSRLVAKRGTRCEARVEVICTGEAVDAHEVLTRGRGGSIVDEANILLVCRQCHEWIHAWPIAAKGYGLLKSAEPAE